jgi:hypothetical protein
VMLPKHHLDLSRITKMLVNVCNHGPDQSGFTRADEGGNL